MPLPSEPPGHDSEPSRHDAPQPVRHVRVKICGVTRPQDALAAQSAGADAIGLIFARASRRRLDVGHAREIDSVLAPWTTRVGVFLDASEAEIVEVLQGVRLDVVQLHGALPTRGLDRLRARVRVVRAVRFVPGTRPDAVATGPGDGILLDGPSPGSGRSFDWAAATAWRDHPGLVVAGGLRADTVARAVALLRPYGVDVASGVEREPGVKDPEAMRAFVRAARSGGGVDTGPVASAQ